MRSRTRDGGWPRGIITEAEDIEGFIVANSLGTPGARELLELSARRLIFHSFAANAARTEEVTKGVIVSHQNLRKVPNFD